MPRSALLIAAAFSAAAITARAADAPLGYVTAVLIGPQDSTGILPAFNKVSGTAVANLDVAIPQALLPRGQAYVVMVMSQVGTSFTGTCKTSFSITQTVGTTTTTIANGAVKPYKCATGEIFGWALNTAVLGGSAGPATLTGATTIGTQKVRMNIPLLLQ
jgi:hypothetical protein